MALAPGDALLIVDVQRDFLPGGALAVPSGDRVLQPIARLIRAFVARGLPVFATRDWHPSHHCSFQAQGGPWPPHCVAGSHGASFPDELALPATAVVVSKASRPDEEAYSGFAGTDLGERLRNAGVRRLVVAGLATDYCVLQTVMDALSRDYQVLLPADAIAAVDVHQGDGDRALERMRKAGARMADTQSLGA